MTALELATLAPLWLPALGAVLILCLEIVQPNRESPLPFALAIATLLAGLLVCGRAAEVADGAAAGRIALDHLGLNFCLLLNGIALLVVLCAQPYLRELRLRRGGEFYALLLFSSCGMMLTVLSRDLLMLFLGIELLSIPMYILAGYRRLHGDSVESSFKYFLFGAFASGFLVYGIALLYGATGSTRFADVGIHAEQLSTLQQLGFAMLTIGLAFKVAAVPFHAWAPDVYQGAPTPVTAFMAAGVKTAAFGATLRLALEVLPDSRGLVTALSVLAAGSMVLGNLGALLQTNLKRMIAYSSIAHAGYLLVGICAVVTGAEAAGSMAVRFYLFTYALMTVGAFAILIHFVRNQQEGENLRGLHGLSRSRPYFSFALALCFLSLAGIPFTAGFFGKLYLLRAALAADLVGLAIVLVVTSIVSLYYYLRVVAALYMKAPAGEQHSLAAPGLSLVSLACAVGIVLLGLFPEPLLHLLG